MTRPCRAAPSVKVGRGGPAAPAQRARRPPAGPVSGRTARPTNSRSGASGTDEPTSDRRHGRAAADGDRCTHRRRFGRNDRPSQNGGLSQMLIPRQGQAPQAAPSASHVRYGDQGRYQAVTFGDYGIQALEPAYVTNRQIESARIAINRHIKRGGKRLDQHLPRSPASPRSRPRPAWVPVRVRPSGGWPTSSPVACSSR